MQRGERCGVDNGLDIRRGIGNDLDGRRVDVVADGLDMPAHTGASNAAAEGEIKMEHHQWYLATQY